MTARLAPEGINVEEAYQTFETDTMGSFNVIAGALGTNRLRHLNVSLASQALLLDLKLFYRFLACLQLPFQLGIAHPLMFLALKVLHHSFAFFKFA